LAFSAYDYPNQHLLIDHGRLPIDLLTHCRIIPASFYQNACPPTDGHFDGRKKINGCSFYVHINNYL
jgi:hypothetical protein